ncbi:alpha/beta hydrolase [Pseudonocardia alni]|uniref:alpha/beta hydrolase n=1 Tax=Pseudonocardia alni TaxID=33907 RepID=UPI00331CA67F
MTRHLYRSFATVEQLDAEYAIHLSVADFDGYLDSYARRSAAARPTLDGTYDLSYGPTSAESFDYFAAPGERGAPLVVYIHGGYWYAGAKADWSFVAEGLVERGVNVAVEEYALCPSVSMSEIVRQHRALVAHLYRQADELGHDRDRIVVVGHSAGGHGAAEVLRTDWSAYGLPDDLVHSAVGISGLYDLAPLPFTFVAPHLQLTGREIDGLSPQRCAPTTDARLLVTYGTKETAEFRRQSSDFAAACRSAGPAVEELALERDHYDIVDELWTADGAITGWIASAVGR